MLGILGGMGPLATVDFMQKVIRSTNANRDQDHIPMMVSCVPQIPDRTDAIRSAGPDPLPEMLRGIVRLEIAGATRIVVPCNTAHFWYDQIAAFARVPIDNIVDVCLEKIRQEDGADCAVGLLATIGTIEGRVYHRRAGGLKILTLDPDGMDTSMQAIRLVKRGDIEPAYDIFIQQVAEFRRRGCRRVVMACTEIPVALTQASELQDILVDPTLVLAKNCVRQFEESQLRSKAA